MQANPDSEVNIENYEATIGAFALRRVDIIIDGPNDVLYMKPNNLRTTQYAYNRLGAVFVPDDVNSENLYAHVVEGSPAYTVGIRNRDILTSVNGLDVTKWRTDPEILPLSRFWNGPAGTRLELTYKRNGGVNRAIVDLAEIFSP
jgi:C-terminal processing protease CtpA/Prc